jgi:hypothetical protein
MNQRRVVLLITLPLLFNLLPSNPNPNPNPNPIQSSTMQTHAEILHVHEIEERVRQWRPSSASQLRPQLYVRVTGNLVRIDESISRWCIQHAGHDLDVDSSHLPSLPAPPIGTLVQLLGNVEVDHVCRGIVACIPSHHNLTTIHLINPPPPSSPQYLHLYSHLLALVLSPTCSKEMLS